MEVQLKKVSKKLVPYPLNTNRLILKKLFYQTSDLPDKNNFK